MSKMESLPDAVPYADMSKPDAVPSEQKNFYPAKSVYPDHSGIGDHRINFGSLAINIIFTILSIVKIDTDKINLVIPSRLPKSDHKFAKIRRERLTDTVKLWSQLKNKNIFIVCLQYQVEEYKQLCAHYPGVIIVAYECYKMDRDYNVGDARNVCLALARHLDIRQLIMTDDDIKLMYIAEMDKKADPITDPNIILGKVLSNIHDKVLVGVLSIRGGRTVKDGRSIKKLHRNTNPSGFCVLDIKSLTLNNLWYCPMKFLEDTIFSNQCSSYFLDGVKCLKSVKINHVSGASNGYSTIRTDDVANSRNFTESEREGIESILRSSCELSIIYIKGNAIILEWTQGVKTLPIYESDSGYKYLFSKNSIVLKILLKMYREKTVKKSAKPFDLFDSDNVDWESNLEHNKLKRHNYGEIDDKLTKKRRLF